MKLLRVVQILCVLSVSLICISLWDMYRLYYPIACPSASKQCLKNYVAKTPHPLLKLWVYSSTSQSPNGWGRSLLWELNDFKPSESITKDVTVRIPSWTFSGTMFVHVFLAPAEGGRGDGDFLVIQTGTLTTYTNPKATPTALQGFSNSPMKQKLVNHWRSCLTLNVMTEDVTFDRKAIPKELTNYVILRPHEDQYLPILLIDEMRYRTKDLLLLNSTSTEMPLKISYTPVSYGTFRQWIHAINTIQLINRRNIFGFTEKDIDDWKETFVKRLYSHLVVFYLLSELLALECDIRFWENRATMGGLSTQAVVWRSISIVAMFLYAMDEQWSIVYKIAPGFLAIVEIWKVFKILKVRFCWTEWRLVVENVGVGPRELETQALDSRAMRWLSFVLYPSWVAVIIYSRKHLFQKGWCSFFIQSLHHGLYSFGFLYNLPQAFINYKLKSVADLPWEVFMFRSFSTFMADTSRFVEMMPIDDGWMRVQHDAIFIIYYYQRWLYRH